MKDYYQILGVNRNATAAEIKHAFRKLAITYHPDRNPSKDADSIIKEVIEAYEVLDDPDKRMLYDSLWVDRVALAEAERLRQRQNQQPPFGRPRAAYYHKSDREEMLEFMFRNLRYAIAISWFTLAFCSLLSLDYFLPMHTKIETIQPQSRRMAGGFLTENGKYKIGDDVRKYRMGQMIEVSYTAVFAVPRTIRSVEEGESSRVPVTVFGNFIFFPVLLLIGSVLGVFYKKGFLFRFNLAIVNFILALITFFLLVLL